MITQTKDVAAKLATRIDDYYGADHQVRPDGSHYWSTGDGDRGAGTLIDYTDDRRLVRLSYDGELVALLPLDVDIDLASQFVLAVLEQQAKDEEAGVV